MADFERMEGSEAQKGSGLDLGAEETEKLTPEKSGEKLKQLREMEASDAKESAEKGKQLKDKVRKMLGEMKKDKMSFAPFTAALEVEKDDDGEFYSLILKSGGNRWQIDFGTLGGSFMVSYANEPNSKDFDTDTFDNADEAYDKIAQMAKSYVETGV